ncbi:MAG: hypothetical protein JNL54_13940 [Kineosporiaceae bacterium]|nr:hypothetical protein [Kineosporiaceae bacterium]
MRRPALGRACVAALVASAVLLGGCRSTDPAPLPAATKHLDGGLRSDPAPVLQRLPGLPQPRTISWASGVFGDPRNPGPSTYWIDAVVTLAAPDAARLAPMATEPRPAPTDLASPVAALLPAGDLLGSASLDAAASPVTGWGARVYLVEGTSTLLITAVGE